MAFQISESSVQKYKGLVVHLIQCSKVQRSCCSSESRVQSTSHSKNDKNIKFLRAVFKSTKVMQFLSHNLLLLSFALISIHAHESVSYMHAYMLAEQHLLYMSLNDCPWPFRAYQLYNNIRSTIIKIMR